MFLSALSDSRPAGEQDTSVMWLVPLAIQGRRCIPADYQYYYFFLHYDCHYYYRSYYYHKYFTIVLITCKRCEGPLLMMNSKILIIEDKG